MVALVVFASGVLGAAGTLALGWRAELAGQRAAVAARLTGSVLDSLRAVVLASGGRCDRLTAGAEPGGDWTEAVWTVSPSPGGREINLAIGYRSLARTTTDTAWTFIPCR